MLQSASKSFASVAIVTMINFEVSICSSIVQYGTVIDFHFRFLGITIFFHQSFNIYLSSYIDN